MAGDRFRRECAWCGAEIADGAPPTSHGICPPCSELLLNGAQPAGAVLDAAGEAPSDADAADA